MDGARRPITLPHTHRAERKSLALSGEWDGAPGNGSRGSARTEVGKETSARTPGASGADRDDATGGVTCGVWPAKGLLCEGVKWPVVMKSVDSGAMGLDLKLCDLRQATSLLCVPQFPLPNDEDGNRALPWPVAAQVEGPLVHCEVAGSVPDWGVHRRQLMDVSLTLMLRSPPPFLSL